MCLAYTEAVLQILVIYLLLVERSMIDNLMWSVTMVWSVAVKTQTNFLKNTDCNYVKPLSPLI